MRKILLPLTACLALCGGAAAFVATNAGAQPAPNPQMTAGHHDGMKGNWRMKRGEHRAEMCKTLVARKAGKLAYLETSLSLTPSQAPLFARWKAVSLDAARRHAENCANRPARTERPNVAERPIAERLARQESRLKQRLADLQAERPALIALADSLTPEQHQAFRHAIHDGRRGRHHHGMGGMMRGFGHHGPQAQPL